MKNKYILPATAVLFIIEYIIFPMIILKFANTETINKVAFFIILSSVFFAFSTNLVVTYIYGRNITIPIMSIIISIALLFVFNKSVFIIIILIIIFSFIGYYLGTIFHKEK
ncbi:hypothetical protein HZY83_05540 [Gemella sp. GH3]|uniref:hypothetical protein n=1 Tax=unclassified Gemella TaxID=2624949 RepID=UPI0015CFB41A|nr:MULTISPECIES: hypothetical protein [unclassified Gemella]MBF0714133.1 hypothetical protein [Gemella sp. GH3.1]NYS51085.1 hypothetical protein [Gemella sp. GH3]